MLQGTYSLYELDLFRDRMVKDKVQYLTHFLNLSSSTYLYSCCREIGGD